ncbi:adenosine deaminase [Pseudosulfitobacter pseudonitzschiae]|uniref:adenosine deaminase n=1 Tax=Pseudosulfitobacter pseudonitzschiae TaxID=1402135 RepID=UPI001AFB98AB|nr:adenosine deaminase [Pseudosulfitobacter pseudonitzschiae]MBM1817850.1 adenosine deaminase [Pseudosulfitobacter pseudonitzschiae]MBM1834907.1 adenosine deaminase [Pseudosulfitobacter pseudonitzschiae]MBM1839708.1 adenosine deaminase [Pseudosulfitobacter pseudonitzschiae]MBM1844623.1 adenosine deaminase [Pseudosulfitobacter pseudonitzschiae]MBM1849394.1 adenosine deaminase [Pseudosulfitobacter pseudonitzschiae]
MIDLHVHLRGTLTPTMACKLAERNSISLDAARWAAKGYGWHDFTSFLQAYDHIASVIATAQDLEEVAYDYLSRSAQLGTTYVEFMLSPPDLMRVGVAFDDQLAALSAARERALELHGIDCRMIATAVRHLGPAAATQAARLAVGRRHDILVGFGLTGDERMFPVGDFKEAFSIARSEGLRATAHAGEHLGPDTIIEAIEVLGLERVGHGIRAVESEVVMRQLASAKIPLEVCLTSNLALNLYPSIGKHPIGRLNAAGCAIVLGTDDPSFFSTDIEMEYSLAAGVGLSAHDITAQANTASFRAILPSRH